VLPRCQAAAAEAEAAALRALQVRRHAAAEARAAEAARLGSALRCEAGARAAAERWLRAELASRVRPCSCHWSPRRACRGCAKGAMHADPRCLCAHVHLHA